jgi:ERCC4-type nuclease
MVVVYDSREQMNQHIIKQIENLGIKTIKKKLDTGDYSILGYEEKITIERKKDLDELAGNFCYDRDRIRKEFERGKEADQIVILFIENNSYEDLLTYGDKFKPVQFKDKNGKIKYRKKMHKNALKGNLYKWQKRYNFYIIWGKKKVPGNFFVGTFKKFLEDNKKNE